MLLAVRKHLVMLLVKDKTARELVTVMALLVVEAGTTAVIPTLVAVIQIMQLVVLVGLEV